MKMREGQSCELKLGSSLSAWFYGAGLELSAWVSKVSKGKRDNIAHVKLR